MLFTPHLWLCSALARSVIAPAFDQSFDAGEAFGLRGHHGAPTLAKLFVFTLID